MKRTRRWVPTAALIPSFWIFLQFSETFFRANVGRDRDRISDFAARPASWTPEATLNESSVTAQSPNTTILRLSPCARFRVCLRRLRTDRLVAVQQTLVLA